MSKAVVKVSNLSISDNCMNLNVFLGGIFEYKMQWTKKYKSYKN